MIKPNPISDMRSLSNRPFAELKQLAINTYGLPPETKCSKVELITYIIAQETFYKRIDHPTAGTTEKRSRYRLICNGWDSIDAEYYLMLTPDQVRLLDWCLIHNIVFSNVTIEEIHEVNWETP